MSLIVDGLEIARRLTPAPLRRIVPTHWRSYFHEQRYKARISAKVNAEKLLAHIDAMESLPFDAYMASEVEPGTTIEPGSHAPGAIEINDSCNINCVMCDTKSATRKKGVMKLELFEQIIRRMASYGYTGVDLHTIGDPLANKNLADYLEVLRRHRFTVGKMSSNCLMMDRHIDTLFEYRDVIRSFRPSVDGATKETYERIRFGGKWEDLLRNLHLFADWNRKAKHPFPVYVNNIISLDNYHEIASIPKVFDFVAEPHQFSFSFITSNSPTDRYFMMANALGSQFAQQRPCSRVWRSMHILKDGSLTTCCRDYNGDLIYGHINDDDLKTVVNNDKIQDIRRAHLSDDKTMLPPLCQTCYTVDPRWSEFVTAIIHTFYLQNGSANVEPLQELLGGLRPMMIDRRYDDLRTAIRNAFAGS